MPYMEWAEAHPFLFYVWFFCVVGLLLMGVTAIAERWMK